ncbi:hypothetical protein L798_04727 [Zootermopsis nevadensis]|uniref:Uncharacterized protein n=1 Tax=Zootermopsis nevadensis TaxID=136037 RepID=A0A067QF97_ZOONE|nr:hypothetical protein L798_04727 [Zootermopsis nevadensis]
MSWQLSNEAQREAKEYKKLYSCKECEAEAVAEHSSSKIATDGGLEENCAATSSSYNTVEHVCHRNKLRFSSSVVC